MAKLQRGDLVHYTQDPQRLGIVTMTHKTHTGADVCEVVIVFDPSYPHTVGAVRYLNQDYWSKVTPSVPTIDDAIKGMEQEYEEAIDLYTTYGES
jgi:hypothetical protein